MIQVSHLIHTSYSVYVEYQTCSIFLFRFFDIYIMIFYFLFLILFFIFFVFFFFQAEDGIRDRTVTGVQTCALPIWLRLHHGLHHGVLPGNRRLDAGRRAAPGRPRARDGRERRAAGRVLRPPREERPDRKSVV